MKLACAAIFFLILLSICAQAATIGVSPARLDFPNVLRGGYSEQRFTVSSSGGDVLYGHFEISGEAASWVHFASNSTLFNITPGTPRIVTVNVQPPEDTPLGSYSLRISAVADAEGSLSGRAGSVVKTAVTLTSSVEVVGDEIRECKAGDFEFRDVEIGQPLEILMTLENEGNVRISPLVSFEIFDQQRENLVEEYDAFAPQVLPTATQRAMIQSLNTLGIGQYWVLINVPECDAESLVTFNVLEKGEISSKGELVEMRVAQSANVLETIPIEASFVNRGERLVSAKFRATIKRDGKVISVAESDTLTVEAGKSALLQTFFVPDSAGRYEVTGVVIYNERLTFEKGTVINVVSDEKPSMPVLLLAYLIILAGLFALARRARKKRHSRHRNNNF